jgi:hypothetical protein
MPDLDFHIEGAEPVAYAAAPLLAFRLRLNNSVPAEAIHTVALRAQIRLEVARRLYTREEQERLLDLFGEPSRWGQTLRSMLWTHASVIVPAFSGHTIVDMQVPCTFDFNVAATKYFYGLSGGELPLLFLFSGTVFYQDETGSLQATPISWEKEATFRVPVSTWRDLMESFYPNSAWLALRKDVFERLYQYKMRGGIPTWEQAIERALDAVEETAGEAARS